ncbi:MAG: hypothetical protein R2854_26040 [Caldilineaceae bacterium]
MHFLRIPSGVLVTGELSTAMQVSCNRCLFPIALPVRFEIEESFRPLTEVATGGTSARTSFRAKTMT